MFLKHISNRTCSVESTGFSEYGVVLCPGKHKAQGTPKSELIVTHLPASPPFRQGIQMANASVVFSFLACFVLFCFKLCIPFAMVIYSSHHEPALFLKVAIQKHVRQKDDRMHRALRDARELTRKPPQEQPLTPL